MSQPRFQPKTLEELYQHYDRLHSHIVAEYGAAIERGDKPNEARFRNFQEMLDDVLTHIEVLLYGHPRPEKPTLRLIQGGKS